MVTSYKVPGVYVEEPFGLSLSINAGATAVPVLAFDATSHATAVFDPELLHEIDTWLDVTAAIQKLREAKSAEKDKKDFDTSVNKDPLYQALRAYFNNGGGRCYLVDVAKLETLVPGLDDATLLVQAGSALSPFAAAASKLYGPGKSLFAIFDGPKEEIKTVAAVAAATRDYPTTPYAAVYYPWLTTEVPSAADPQKPVVVDVPPSAAVAGAYGAVDRERGVWKAPANVELRGGIAPKFKVSDTIDAECNVPGSNGPKAVNVIRAFRGTGPLIWGARTLQADQNNWKYVPVRRLFNAVEKDLHTAMSTALFEPNSQPTWERVRGAVANYLHGLWQQGALLGNTPEEAYFVRIGKGITMSQLDIEAGNLIVEVGLSAVRPAEFIVLQLTQDVVPA